MKHRRVVITGLGILAPNGIGKDEFWNNLVAGKSSIDYISSFDVSAYPSKIAGQVKSFSPRDYLSARVAKTAARFSQFAMAATRLALDDAKLTLEPIAGVGSCSLLRNIGQRCWGHCR